MICNCGKEMKELSETAYIPVALKKIGDSPVFDVTSFLALTMYMCEECNTITFSSQTKNG